MKKKGFATTAIATALVLALGFMLQLSAHAAAGAKSTSTQVNPAETIVVQEDQILASGDSPSAEALRQAVYAEEGYPYPNLDSAPDDVRYWSEISEVINQNGYYYQSEVGEGDEEITFIGYDLRHGPARPDFLDIRQSGVDDTSVGVLGVGDDYALQVRLRNITPHFDAENVAVSVECHTGQESLIVVVHITYGDSGQLTYAEKFPVYNPQRKNFYVNQDDVSVSLMNGIESLSSENCSLLTGESFAVGYEEFDGALPYGKEYSRELRATFSLEEILPTPAPQSQSWSSQANVDKRPFPYVQSEEAFRQAQTAAEALRIGLKADQEDYDSHPGPNGPEETTVTNADRDHTECDPDHRH